MSVSAVETQPLVLLRVCLDRYDEAVADHQERQTVATAEALIAARIEAYTCLSRGGWSAPIHVEREIFADRRLLRQCRGAGDG